MFLLNPAALGFAVLAPVIIALYLLKLRRQPARVSTLLFWRRVVADTRRRALFQRLRQVLSLLLHLLIFALLLFALARPELRAFRGAGAGLTTVVVLDARARMQTRLADGGTRFEAARRLAAGYLRRASSRQPVALLVADGSVRVAVGLSEDEKTLLAGLDAIRPTDAGGELDGALGLAGELLAGRRGEKRLVVVTDRPPSLPPGISPAGVETRVVTAGEFPRENVGITRMSARALPNSPETGEVFVELENFGPTRRTGNVELSYEGQTVDVKPYDLAPGERHAEVYPALSTRGGVLNARGWLTAHLAPSDNLGDALPLDDDAFAVLPPPRSLRILLVTRGNFFLENLLKADPQITFDQLAPDAFQPEQAAGFDATILDDTLPEAFGSTPETLPAKGNFLFVRRAPLPGAEGAGELVRPPVTDLDADSPLLRLVNLREVTVLRAQAWNLPGAGTTTGGAGGWRFAAPVRSLEHPLVATGERGGAGRGGQRFVALAFGAADSDLPLRVAFPLFVRDALGWLAGRGASDLSGESLRAGGTLTLAEGETLWTRPQRTYGPVDGIPEGERQVGPGAAVLNKSGFYLRRTAVGLERWLAVNPEDRTVSAVNSDQPTGPNPSGPARPVSVAPSPTLRFLAAWPPWVHLAGAALALCALEWWGFHRRRTE